MTSADLWWIVEMREFHAQRAELAHGERVMVRALLKVSVILPIAVLCGTWLW